MAFAKAASFPTLDATRFSLAGEAARCLPVVGGVDGLDAAAGTMLGVEAERATGLWMGLSKGARLAGVFRGVLMLLAINGSPKLVLESIGRDRLKSPDFFVGDCKARVMLPIVWKLILCEPDSAMDDSKDAAPRDRFRRPMFVGDAWSSTVSGRGPGESMTAGHEQRASARH